MRRSLAIIGAIVLVIGSQLPVWGAGGDSIQLVSKGEKEVVSVSKDGKKEVKRISLDKVLPGDTVVFTNHYKNSAAKAAENSVITNPVPANMTYVGGSAFGDGTTITFSSDKGKTFDVPGKLTKTEKGMKRPVRPEEYTHIRWTFLGPIPPGKEGDVGFKALLK